jgi:hypothetical protein
MRRLWGHASIGPSWVRARPFSRISRPIGSAPINQSVVPTPRVDHRVLIRCRSPAMVAGIRVTAWTGAGPCRQRCSKPVPLAGRGERLRPDQARCRRGLGSIDVLGKWMKSLTSSSRHCPVQEPRRAGRCRGNPLRQDRTD